MEGLTGVRVHVPMAVRRGETAVLKCLFDLEGEALYSVKWYKGGHEIYRFIPKEVPSIKMFPIHGLDIEVINKSNACMLTLLQICLFSLVSMLDYIRFSPSVTPQQWSLTPAF